MELVGIKGAIYFDKLVHGFTTARSDLPFTCWDANAEGWHSVLGAHLPVPGVAELQLPLIERRDGGYYIHFDVLGLTYWMLARVEEIDRTDLDIHERFPASSSHAFKYGYLERPIVDEWLHILGQVVHRQWPGLKVKKHSFKRYVSHDVDRPSRYGFANLKNLARRMAGDTLRGNLKGALFGPWVRLNTKTRLHPSDLYNTFDWIMDQSDQHGLTSAFYFICGHTSTMDGEYQIEHHSIRNLLRRIHARGHEIGLHPSYNTYDNPNRLKCELNRLQQVCAEEGVQQTVWGGRMHYLRWKHPITLRALADAGICYDSTLGYADHAGFRCGTCMEYMAWDSIEDSAVNIRIRPLVAMECAVLAKRRMALERDCESMEKFLSLMHACKAVGGNFSLLWHNSELHDKSLRKTYERLL